MADCLFCSIIKKEIPCIAVYEDDEILAFHDIDPKAPVHILLVPKAHIESAADLTQEDSALLGRLFAVAANLAKENNLEKGWRIVSNVGKQGGQSVPHLHFHLLGGRAMAWPPG